MPHTHVHPAKRTSAAPPTCRRRFRAAGFTLPEALMASIVLAFSVTALLQAIGAGQMQTYHAMHEARAAALNEAMLDEILRDPYSQLDLWHGYTQESGEIADAHDELHDPAFQRFEQHVAVQTIAVDMPTLGTVTGKRITVTLEDDARDSQWVVHRFVHEPAASITGGGDSEDEMYEEPAGGSGGDDDDAGGGSGGAGESGGGDGGDDDDDAGGGPGKGKGKGKGKGGGGAPW